MVICMTCNKGETPILYGEDAVEFLKEMARPPTKKEIEYWKDVEKNHRSNWEFL